MRGVYGLPYTYPPPRSLLAPGKDHGCGFGYISLQSLLVHPVFGTGLLLFDRWFLGSSLFFEPFYFVYLVMDHRVQPLTVWKTFYQ